MTVEQRLQSFVEQYGDSGLPPYVLNFLQIVRTYSAMGLGYGFMIQLIEWEWQHATGGQVRGPESLNLQVKAMSEEIQDLRETLRLHGIEPPV